MGFALLLPMSIRRTFLFLTAGLSLLGATQAFGQSKWDVVLNGRSVHLHASQDWNEDNWGLGIEREFGGSSRWVKLALANGFRDSLDHPSYMAGGGLKRRFRLFEDRFYVDLGMIGFVMTRQDVSHNRPFPGVLPAVTLGTKHLAVNITYLPESAVDSVTNANRRDPTLNGILFVQFKLAASLFRPVSSRHLVASENNN